MFTAKTLTFGVIFGDLMRKNVKIMQKSKLIWAIIQRKQYYTPYFIPIFHTHILIHKNCYNKIFLSTTPFSGQLLFENLKIFNLCGEWQRTLLWWQKMGYSIILIINDLSHVFKLFSDFF